MDLAVLLKCAQKFAYIDSDDEEDKKIDLKIEDEGPVSKLAEEDLAKLHNIWNI